MGAREGPSGGWRLPGASVTTDAASGGPISETVSSKGSKMRGSASDDMVPSVASSGDSWTTVSAASGIDETMGFQQMLLVSDVRKKNSVVFAQASL